MPRLQKVAVIGLGYIGLPTAATLASVGHQVLGIDINESVVATINEGRIHISELDLDELVHNEVVSGRLKASTSVQPADTFVITVPTPVHADNSPDMSYVTAALQAIAPVLQKSNLVIIESTSRVGTTDSAARQLAALRPDLSFPDTHPETSDVLLAYCPERVLPGATLRELVENARVLGGLDEASGQRALELYGTFVKGQMLVAGAKEAEMSKLTENAFRDVNIAFANELAMVCEHLGIDVWTVIKSANLHPRVNILSPGAGVGGHCIPVDPWFIIDAAPSVARIMRLARETNHAKTKLVAERIAAGADRKDTPIALFGLSYKPDIDDLRESPSIEILDYLLDQGYNNVMAVEPNIQSLPPALAGKSVRLVEMSEALSRAEVIGLLVRHKQFAEQTAAFKTSAKVVDPTGLLG